VVAAGAAAAQPCRLPGVPSSFGWTEAESRAQPQSSLPEQKQLNSRLQWVSKRWRQPRLRSNGERQY
jgi:hypothetical protein